MGNMVYQNQKVFLGPYNLTANVNSVALSETRDALDDTTLGSNTKSNFPGLCNVTFQVEGLFDPSTQYDQALSSQLGIQAVPFTITQSSSAGQTAHFLNAMQADYTPYNNAVGELASFSAGGVTAKASSAPANLIRGYVAYLSENFTTSANGTALNLGAVSTEQRLYAAVHVFGHSSTQHTVYPVIASAASSGVSSTQWTTVIGFSTFAALGSSMLSCTGGITDTWFRLQQITATSSASTGCSMLAVIGIY